MSAQFPAGELTQAQAAAIVAYLKTLRGAGGGGQPAPGQGGPAVAERPRPALYYAGWVLLALGLLLAVMTILAYVAYAPPSSGSGPGSGQAHPGAGAPGGC